MNTISNNKKSICVFIVDDKLDLVLENLKRLEIFTFRGIKSFDPGNVIKAMQENDECRVLLLDRMTPEDSDAGIKLFQELGKSEAWKKKPGAIQVVFFSDENKAIKDYQIAKDKRIDLSGSISKPDLYRGKRNALEVLRSADEWAKLYREFPIMADPILAECELLFHPNSHAMREVLHKVLLAGRCWEPVLIQGESGTGKELVAKAIYKVVETQGKTFKGCNGFYPYNIGSAPREGNLQYTELFGALRGSATGISEDRIGLFERATGKRNSDTRSGRFRDNTLGGGTIFLDEIGDAAPIIQVSLLRVLQENEIVPLGGFNAKSGENVTREVKFRLITASHVDLPEKITVPLERGGFRPDLFYRLNTIQIRIPPLRERKDDIPIFVYHFIEKLDRDYKSEKKIIDPENLFEELKRYDWPGNVRQLETAIRASYVMSPGNVFTLSDEIKSMMGRDSSVKVGITIEDILADLEKDPQRLPDIAKQYGKDRAVEVGRMFVNIYGGGEHWPSTENAQKLFKSSIGSVKKWLQDRGVTVRKKRGTS